MNIEMGKLYKTRDGERVRILTVDRRHETHKVVGLVDTRYGCNRKEDVFAWSLSGCYNDNGAQSDHDLVAEWVEPYKFEGWANVYPSNKPNVYYTKEAADSNGGPGERTIKVLITEVPE